MSTLAERILIKLDEANLNPRRAALKAGLGDSAIRDIISGKSNSPTLATIEALCRPLGCSVAYLVGEDSAPVVRPSVNRFWMVLGLGQGVPRYQHGTQESAETEAQRLAGEYPGVTLVVLETVAAFKAEKPTVNQFDIVAVKAADDGDIPF